MIEENTKAQISESASRGLIYAVLTIGAVAAASPFVWMILTSLKSYREVATRVFIPQVWRFSNYVDAWNAAPFARYFANSVFIAIVTVAGVLFTSVLAGYAFARLDFFGKNVIFVLFLATMMIPFEVTLIPNFIIIQRLGWYNSFKAMTIPWVASVFSIFLFRQFFRSIPEDLYDAALLDGCGHTRFLISVVLPLSKPALVTVGLFNFLGSWNALLWPLIITSDSEMRPIQVGLSYFVTESGTDTQLLMAAATLTILPILVLYFLAQKQFMEGIAFTGIQG